MTTSPSSTSRPFNFDLVVLGGGPAGASGAAAAAVFGQRVALVEQAREVGGAGVMTGTLPSKTLRETAVALSGLRARKLFGVDLSIREKATISDFTHHQQQVSAGESERIANRLQTLGVERFQGTGSFIDAHTIRVAHSGAADLQLRGEKILIATGSSSFHPPSSLLKMIACMTRTSCCVSLHCQSGWRSSARA